MTRRRTGRFESSLITVAVLFAVLRLINTPTAAALRLTGILLQALDGNGNPTGVVWHTSSSGEGRVLGITNWVPKQLHIVPLANRDSVDLDMLLLPGTYIATLFWQYGLMDYPRAMMMNFYFNGDNLNPGISAFISGKKGLTQFQANTNPRTMSLYLREVDNSAGLFFDDGQLRARLGAAFYVPSKGLTDQWRPSDLENLDRVGMTALKHDGVPDGVLLYELTVEASQQAPLAGATPVRPRAPAPVLQGPLTAHVGGDQWVVPSTPTLPAVLPTPVRSPQPLAGAAPTPSSPEDEEDETPPPATTSPEPAASGTPETPGATPFAGQASTPSPKQTVRGAGETPAAPAVQTSTPPAEGTAGRARGTPVATPTGQW